MQYYYLLALIFSLAGLLYADRVRKLVIFHDPKLALSCLIIAVCFFLSWDIAGIVSGIFSTNQEWISGLHVISPDLPIEEIFFLILFGYTTLISWRLVCSRTS